MTQSYSREYNFKGWTENFSLTSNWKLKAFPQLETTFYML